VSESGFTSNIPDIEVRVLIDTLSAESTSVSNISTNLSNKKTLMQSIKFASTRSAVN